MLLISLRFGMYPCVVQFLSCPEGETHQNDVKVTTESGSLETRLQFGSHAQRITDANTH